MKLAFSEAITEQEKWGTYWINTFFFLSVVWYGLRAILMKQSTVERIGTRFDSKVVPNMNANILAHDSTSRDVTIKPVLANSFPYMSTVGHK